MDRNNEAVESAERINNIVRDAQVSRAKDNQKDEWWNCAFSENPACSVDMNPPQMAELENCETEEVPKDTVDMQGKKKMLVPELLTMNKVLFDKFRLPMYSYLNRCLRQGIISALVGERVTTPRIKSEQCSFNSGSCLFLERTYNSKLGAGSDKERLE